MTGPSVWASPSCALAGTHRESRRWPTPMVDPSAHPKAHHLTGRRSSPVRWTDRRGRSPTGPGLPGLLRAAGDISAAGPPGFSGDRDRPPISCARRPHGLADTTQDGCPGCLVRGSMRVSLLRRAKPYARSAKTAGNGPVTDGGTGPMLCQKVEYRSRDIVSREMSEFEAVAREATTQRFRSRSPLPGAVAIRCPPCLQCSAGTAA